MDRVARLYAVNDRRGVMVGVWIFDKLTPTIILLAQFRRQFRQH